MTMAAIPYPLITLAQDQNFLGRSRNCCIIRTRTTQAFPGQKRKDLFKNEVLLSNSEFNFRLKIRDAQIGGVASFCAISLPSGSNSGRHLRAGGDRIGFSGASLLPLRRSRLPSLWIRLMSQNDNPSATPPESPQTVRCVIKGRVQGVFYRNWTVENAAQLGLKGWVRNRRDGSVEALFSGKPESVDEMQQRCRRGPPAALVTGFQAFPCSDDPGTRFELKPTA